MEVKYDRIILLGKKINLEKKQEIFEKHKFPSPGTKFKMAAYLQ